MSTKETKPNTSSTDNSDSGGCCSCLTFILLAFALWALCFGVTVKGFV